MKIIHRIHQYLNENKIKTTPFELQIGVSAGYFKKMKDRNADVGEGNIIKFIDYCPEINIVWLITGEGEMLKSVDDGRPSAEPTTIYKSDPRDIELIDLQRKQIKLLEEKLNERKPSSVGFYAPPPSTATPAATENQTPAVLSEKAGKGAKNSLPTN